MTTNNINALTPKTKARVALENTADLPKGKSLTLRGTNRDLFVLRRQAAGERYFLRLENPTDTQHSRFADNTAQLLEDLEYFYATDALPFDKVDWH